MENCWGREGFACVAEGAVVWRGLSQQSVDRCAGHAAVARSCLSGSCGHENRTLLFPNIALGHLVRKASQAQAEMQCCGVLPLAEGAHCSVLAPTSEPTCLGPGAPAGICS